MGPEFRDPLRELLKYVRGPHPTHITTVTHLVSADMARSSCLCSSNGKDHALKLIKLFRVVMQVSRSLQIPINTNQGHVWVLVPTTVSVDVASQCTFRAEFNAHLVHCVLLWAFKLCSTFSDVLCAS